MAEPLFPYSHPMDTTPDEDEDIAISGNDFVGLEEDAEIKAAMATLTDVNTEPPTPFAISSNSNVKEGTMTTFSSNYSHSNAAVNNTHSNQFNFSGVEASRSEGGNGIQQQRDLSSRKEELGRTSSAMTIENSGGNKSSGEDDEIPVAVPVAEGEDGGEGVATATAVVATIVNENGDAKKNQKDGGSEKKRSNSDAGGAKKTKRKYVKKSSSGGEGGAPSSSGAATRSKSYQGSYRSAAAAHRNRQIHVPPIGSPGLLMLPTAASTAIFPPTENEEEAKKQWLFKEKYLLPSTVFQQSMKAGGYTLEKRKEIPHRGSSTEREVGDMFDSDAGGLYLHFPELIPERVWDRRLGDETKMEEGGNDDETMMAKNEADGVKAEKGNDGANGAKKNSNDSSSSKKKKDDGHNGPKGARSSYIFFTNTQRPKMISEFPGMRFTEQGVIMGERWRALTPDQKKPFEEMANKDKERHSKEMAEYIESVKREIRDEKLLKGNKEKHGVKEEGKDGHGGVKQESKNDDEGSKMKEKNTPTENEIKGPRLVDAMILSLSKMLGEKVHRKDEILPKEPAAVSSSSVVQPEPVPSSSGNNAAVPPPPRHVSPDLTLDELPRFNNDNNHQPRTRKRPRPHSPLSFLDMIPISLTATYPPSYVAKRRAYALAVRAREDAIIDAQEAKDDADDAQEKYVAHTEAWERMLEYQKGQIAKREMERKRKSREQKEKEERERREAAELADMKGGEDGDVTASISTDGADEASAIAGDDGKKVGMSPSKEVEEKKVQQRSPTPPPEDPMECMPPRPQPPGPARIVVIPDVPTPPTPPPVIEMENDEEYDNNHGNDRNNNSQSDNVDRTTKMLAPKLNTSLLSHLDSSCFLPTLSSGRYFGLLSNAIADPQFCGAMAPGIAGMTYGGGTGLATSYAGGGRGAVGLVSGPLRGGNLWQTPAGVGSSGSGASSKSSGCNEGSKVGERRSSTKDKAIMPDEVKSKSPASVVSDGAIPTVVGSSSNLQQTSKVVPPTIDSPIKEKRPASSIVEITTSLKIGDASTTTTPTTSEKKKKQKRTTFGLATGDRNTSATEIASGNAGSEFPEGWIIKTYRRSGGETIGKTDRFWFSPGRNIRFRAKKHAKNFVDILNEPNVNGDEDKAAEIYRARGLHF